MMDCNESMESLDLIADDIQRFKEEIASAALMPPPYTEILPEEALKYIEAMRRNAYNQGYIEGVEDIKNIYNLE